MNETIDQAAVQTVDEAQRRNIPVQHVEGQTQPMMGSEQVDITRVVPQVEMNGDAQILTFPEQPPLPEAPPQPEDPQETASSKSYLISNLGLLILTNKPSILG